MRPTLVRQPFRRDGWIYEEKVDGYRMLAYKDGSHVRLVSRNGVDHTRRFADIVAAVGKLSARAVVLDGEVAIFDEQLRSRFDWLREPDRAAVGSPPVYMAFDLLYCDGRDLTARPLATVASGWRALSRAASWCSRFGGSRLTVWPRGSRSSERVREVRRQGRGQRVRGRRDAAVAEGEAEGLDGR